MRWEHPEETLRLSGVSLRNTWVCFLGIPDNPVVRRELRSYGYSYSLFNGELRSYQEFPSHILGPGTEKTF